MCLPGNGLKMTKKDIDILILDDDVDLLTSVAELLADCGYKVKGFADPESAVEFAVDQTFAVGIFDFRLGSVKNGLDVIETLQVMGAKSTYVMVTADVERSTQVRAADMKIFEFMRKPVQPEELLDIVTRAMALTEKMAA